MLVLKTKDMELRGITSQVSKKTNQPYYLVFVEDLESYEPFKFLCKDFNAMPQGLKKGDIVELTVAYNNYKDLSVLKVEKVG